VDLPACVVTPDDALKGLEFRVEPPLPAGLAVNTETGALSGTAEAEHAQTVHKIIASNKAGEVSVAVTVRVQDGVAPESITYDFGPDVLYNDTDLELPRLHFVVGQEVGPLTGTVTPEEAHRNLEFSCDEFADLGLEFDAQGAITGTVSAPAEWSNTGETEKVVQCRIVAKNHQGEVSTPLTIRVRHPNLEAPHARKYEERNATYEDENLFCRIAKKEIPCHLVYEDEHHGFISFLDINPVVRGHTIVTTQKLYQSMDAVHPDLLASLYQQIPKIAAAVCDVVGAKDYNVLSNNGSVAGQTIFNFHVHIIPRTEGDGFTVPWESTPGNPEELAITAERIRGLLCDATEGLPYV